MYRRRFLPRVYDRNFEIGNTLYTDAITDLNIRRGKAPFSSSNAITTTSLDRFNVFRDDMRLHDSVYARHASAEMVERMRVKRHFHQRMLRMSETSTTVGRRTELKSARHVNYADSAQSAYHSQQHTSREQSYRRDAILSLNSLKVGFSSDPQRCSNYTRR